MLYLVSRDADVCEDEGAVEEDQVVLVGGEGRVQSCMQGGVGGHGEGAVGAGADVHLHPTKCMRPSP